jgi:hypothetical protein
MKKLGILLCCLATTAFADEPTPPNQPGNQGPGGNRFEQMKQDRLDGIQSRITIDQTLLSCVQGAQKREDMERCDDTAKTAMDNLRKAQQQKMQSMRQASQQNGQSGGMGSPQGGMGPQQQGPGQQSSGSMDQPKPGMMRPDQGGMESQQGGMGPQPGQGPAGQGPDQPMGGQ